MHHQIRRPNDQPPIQIVSATLSNGMVINAAVDLWVSTLLEVIDEDVRSAWLTRMVETIQEQQAQPRIFTLDQSNISLQ